MDFRDERSRALFEGYPPKSLQRFKQWNVDNPEIFKRFKAAAVRMKKTGRKHYSGYPIFYHMRYEYDLVTKGDPFKINNNYLSMLIRLLIYHLPEFDGWFELREIRMKGIPSAEERKRRDEDGEYIH